MCEVEIVYLVGTIKKKKVYAVLEFYIWARRKWRFSSVQVWLNPKRTYPLQLLEFQSCLYSCEICGICCTKPGHFNFILGWSQNFIWQTYALLLIHIILIHLPHSYKYDEYYDVTDYIIIILQTEIFMLPTNHLLA